MFGKGKIDISIQKTNYAPGGTITGNVTLTLKKPVRAKELSISLIGEYRTTQTVSRVGTLRVGGIPGRGRRSWMERGMLMHAKTTKAMGDYDSKTVKKTVRICAFKQLLDGESEYGRDREYPFEIKIQADVSTSQVIKWYLLTKLDVPGRLDISKEVGITIG